MTKPAHISKYSAIAGILRNNITENRYKEGTLIPTEKEIADQNAVSLITVKKAISVLIDEGYLERLPGKKGTFVTRNKQLKDRPNLIGIAIDDVSENFGSQILRGIEDKLEEAGYYSIICSSDRNFEKVQKYFTSLLKNDVSGIIFAPVIGEKYIQQNQKILDPVIGNNIPYVLIDRYIPELSSNVVMPDHRRSGQLITEELISQGHTKTLIIHSENCTSMVDRFTGIKDIYAKHDLSIDENLIIQVDDNKWPYTIGGEDYKAIEKQIEEAGHFTAVYSLNNRLLNVVLQIIESNKNKYGGNITFAVNDEDDSILPEGNPGILHTKQSSIELGRKAAELLLENIHEPECYKSQIIFADELIKP